MKTIKVEHDMANYTCEKCGHVNTEFFPWPVNAECEKCGHAQPFGIERQSSESPTNG